MAIWFSDDPNLNEQTKDRLRQASEKFTYDQLITVKHPFVQTKLDPHKVYFLNTGKLTKSSLLTRGGDDDQVFGTIDVGCLPGPAERHGLETIANTIGDPELPVYLVLDELIVGSTAERRGTSQCAFGADGSSTATAGRRRCHRVGDLGDDLSNT